MPDTSPRAILVTGSHRSGTTWTGRMLAASSAVGLIMEPFVPIHHRRGVCSARLRFWFPYLRTGEGLEHVPAVARMLRFDYRVAAGIAGSRSLRDLARLGRDVVLWQRYRRLGARPLLKDPSALLLTPWLAHHFGVQPVVLIRHPAAFISSIKTLNWRYAFGDLLRQPHLIEDHLSSFESAIADQARQPADLIDEGILVWNVLHKVISDFRTSDPGWIFVRHEDLSLDPIGGFRGLCRDLDLEFDEPIRARIDEYCGSTNPADATAKSIPVQRARSLKRNSVENITNWKRRLSGEEIRRIRDGVAEIATEFYGENEW